LKEKSLIDTPNTNIHARSFSWLGTHTKKVCGTFHIYRHTNNYVNSNINILLFVTTELKKNTCHLKEFKKVDLLTFYTFCSNNVR